VSYGGYGATSYSGAYGGARYGAPTTYASAPVATSSPIPA